jgi:DNA ligase-1
MTNFAPLLAGPADFRILRFPLLASYKLDGIRAIVRNGIVMSRNGKPIPNKAVQARFSHLEHFDGELITGSPCSVNTMQNATTGAMTIEGDHGTSFYAFDHVEHPDKPYIERAKLLVSRTPGLVVINQQLIQSIEELTTFEAHAVEQGYEGIMIRSIDGRYKFGRSTPREQILLKVKRFADAEFEVVSGLEEIDKHGVPKDSLGALLLRTADGQYFKCGTGFSAEQRRNLWACREALPGRLAKVKYMEVGMVNVPRFPVFLGWRHAIDM